MIRFLNFWYLFSELDDNLWKLKNVTKIKLLPNSLIYLLNLYYI